MVGEELPCTVAAGCHQMMGQEEHACHHVMAMEVGHLEILRELGHQEMAVGWQLDHQQMVEEEWQTEEGHRQTVGEEQEVVDMQAQVAALHCWLKTDQAEEGAPKG